jgi:hypothetical protein
VAAKGSVGKNLAAAWELLEPTLLTLGTSTEATG